ncbi:MAG: hypothetical protein QM811_21530 [Pirellulales bacterium]
MFRGEKGTTTWGPTTLTSDAAASHEAAVVARRTLATIAPADVSIRIEWPEGENGEGDAVLVTLDYVHKPILPFPNLYTSLPLRGVSRVRIAR